MLQVRGLAKSYQSGRTTTEAIRSLDFTVDEGEFFCIVGPSGCGKTTLLKCLAGLLRPTRGMVLLNGKEISKPPRDMAVVFQDYSRSLFPWYTVRQNVLLPIAKLGGGAERIASEALRAVGLEKFVGHYPSQLSGGMQQRVAIARALAYQPKVLLMDEPFASVDAQTRSELEDLVLRVWKELKVTVVLVTHDIDEAVYMASRVVILSKSPTTVKEELSVGLPFPRHQVTTKEMHEFAKLRAHVYLSIMGEGAVSPIGKLSPTDRTPEPAR